MGNYRQGCFFGGRGQTQVVGAMASEKLSNTGVDITISKCDFESTMSWTEIDKAVIGEESNEVPCGRTAFFLPSLQPCKRISSSHEN